MGCGASNRSWLLVTLLAAACSSGVLEANQSGAFPNVSATASTTAATSETTDEGTPSETSSVTPAESDADEGTPIDSSEGAPASSEGTAASCGNGIVEGSEDCDGDDLGGSSCVDFGFDDGAIVCDPECHLVTDACFTCGDGEIALGEVCDGTNLSGQSCTSLGFGGGTLTCSADCQTIVDDACTPLPSCGDGMLNGGEQCDGNQLGGASCVTQGFDLGELGCTAACTYDVSACMDDLSDCGMQGDLCIFDENDPQSTCCPAGVGGNIFGLCDVFLCV
jgi:hypothetical protein